MFKKARCIYIIDRERVEFHDQGHEILHSLQDKFLYDLFFDTEEDHLIEHFLDLLPQGTIFSESIVENSKPLEYFISLPMFSSHFKLPIKTGEYIWVYPHNDFDNVKSNSKSYFNLINSYWISRVHSLFHTEDLNYNYNDRDFIINAAYGKHQSSEKLTAKQKKERKEKLKKIDNHVLEQTTDVSNLIKTNDTCLSVLSEEKNKYSFCNVPRDFSNTEDFVIQGSNNTTIKLGYSNKNTNKSSGEISIVAGKGYVENNKIKQQKIYKEIDVDDNRSERKSKIRIPEFDSNFSLEINNGEDKLENFKHPSISTKNIKNSDIKRNLNEGKLNIKEDASSIIVSEKNTLDNTLDLKLSKRINIKSFEFEDKSSNKNDIQTLLGLQKESLSSNKIKKIKVTKEKKSFSNDSPNIGIVSSNIRLYSRKDSDLNSSLEDGSIYIVKESNDEEKYAEISLHPDGNIILDGNKIIIGDYDREENKKNGMGTSVILGSNGELHSIVLGEKIVSLLTELIEINKESLSLISLALQKTKNNFDDINDNFNSIDTWANSHIHVSAPPGVLTSVTSLPNQSPVKLESVEIENSYKENGGSEIERLSDLINNIDKILSKFVQTS